MHRVHIKCLQMTRGRKGTRNAALSNAYIFLKKIIIITIGITITDHNNLTSVCSWQRTKCDI